MLPSDAQSLPGDLWGLGDDFCSVPDAPSLPGAPGQPSSIRGSSAALCAAQESADQNSAQPQLAHSLCLQEGGINHALFRPASAAAPREPQAPCACSGCPSTCVTGSSAGFTSSGPGVPAGAARALPAPAPAWLRAGREPMRTQALGNGTQPPALPQHGRRGLCPRRALSSAAR